MNKRKVTLVTVTFDNGETDTFEVDATFSESFNSRKRAGFANLQEWIEYHLTWCRYMEPEVLPGPEPVGKVDREALRGKAWCAQHGCDPHDCFTKHNSNAFARALDAAMKIAEQDAQRWRDNFAKPLLAENKPKVDSIFPEFNLDDIQEGYGNGKVT